MSSAKALPYLDRSNIFLDDLVPSSTLMTAPAEACDDELQAPIASIMVPSQIKECLEARPRW